MIANLVVTAIPIILLALLFIVMLAMLSRWNRKALARREQAEKAANQVIVDLIVPELQAIRQSIEATASELRQFREETRAPANPNV